MNIIKVENSFCGNRDAIYFSGFFFMNRKFKRKAFIWKRYLL